MYWVSVCITKGKPILIHEFFLHSNACFTSNFISKFLGNSVNFCRFCLCMEVFKCRFTYHWYRFADLADSNAHSAARRRNISVCSYRVDKDLILWRRSWNVCILRHWNTSYHSVQPPELLELFETFRHSSSEDPSHIEQLHQYLVSSVSAIAVGLRFQSTSLRPSTKLPPKRLSAPFLCFAPKRQHNNDCRQAQTLKHMKHSDVVEVFSASFFREVETQDS